MRKSFTALLILLFLGVCGWTACSSDSHDVYNSGTNAGSGVGGPVINPAPNSNNRVNSPDMTTTTTTTHTDAP